MLAAAAVHVAHWVALPALRCFPLCPTVCLRTPMARIAVLPLGAVVV